MLVEYLSLFKACIACICDLLVEKSYSAINYCPLQRLLAKENKRRHAFFNGIPSLSGSIPWIAIKTSAGARRGPEWDDPCARTIEDQEENNHILYKHIDGLFMIFAHSKKTDALQMLRLPRINKGTLPVVCELVLLGTCPGEDSQVGERLA